MAANPYCPIHCPRCGANLPSFDEQIICAYCGTTLVRAAGEAEKAAAAQAGAGAEPRVVKGIRLKVYTCRDEQGTGIDAFRLLMPAGWQAQGGIQWNQNNPSSPAHIHFRMVDPNTGHALTILPHLSFYFSNDMIPVGSIYFGREVRPPVDALTALRDLVVPRFRAVQGLQIVTQERLPDLPAQLRALNPCNQGANLQADGAKITIRYPEGERVYDEEIAGLTEYSVQQMPALFGIKTVNLWTVDYLIAQRAPRGQLPASREIFQVMLKSFQINPHWFANVAQMIQYLTQNQIQQIRDIGELSGYIRRVNNQISDTIAQGYNQRQATLDSINRQFSQSIRGVESYHDPYKGYAVELPGGYRCAWANPLGEYIVSDSATFNPNIGSTQTWTEMR